MLDLIRQPFLRTSKLVLFYVLFSLHHSLAFCSSWFLEVFIIQWMRFQLTLRCSLIDRPIQPIITVTFCAFVTVHHFVWQALQSSNICRITWKYAHMALATFILSQNLEKCMKSKFVWMAPINGLFIRWLKSEELRLMN